ncbi:flavin-containing monooxygenase [Enemella sp. A6]|uniref:flavin-containing monooxygenase n=1 Tax=Enemella sp. A6 TaxID=3440152 RepID=UPI003EBFCCB9
MKIAVIGAGFAGVAAVKTLTQFGHDVTGFEKAPDVGGVWSRVRRYPGLSTQNNKGTYSLIEMPYPKHYPEWPSGTQVQEYLAGYVRRFGIEDKIKVSTEVVHAELDESGPQPRWTVTYRPVESRFGGESEPAGPEESEVFDYVVVANGIFSQPFLPPYPGREEFEAAGGRLCAPSDVRDLAEIEGKNVLVVGYGKSGCDIASAVAESSASTTVVARHLLWKLPKKLMGKLNFKYLMLNRLGEALFEYRRPTPVEKFLHGPGKPVRNGMINTVQGVAVKQLKLKEHDLVPEGSFDRIARSTVSLTTDGFYEKVAEGKLQVLRETEIVRLYAEDGKPMAELSTGERRPADVVIAATGWKQGVPFLDDEVTQRLTDDRGNFELWRYILPHDVPGLAFCGYNSSFFSPLSAELGALWIANHLMGHSVMPEVEQRRELVAERLRWMEERTEGKHARGTNIIPFSMHNIDELMRGLGLKISPLQRFKEWLLPVSPQDYAWVIKALLRRKEGKQSR